MPTTPTFSLIPFPKKPFHPRSASVHLVTTPPSSFLHLALMSTPSCSLTSWLDRWTQHHSAWQIHPQSPGLSHHSKPSKHHHPWHLGSSQPHCSAHQLQSGTGSANTREKVSESERGAQGVRDPRSGAFYIIHVPVYSLIHSSILSSI